MTFRSNTAGVLHTDGVVVRPSYTQKATVRRAKALCINASSRLSYMSYTFFGVKEQYKEKNFLKMVQEKNSRAYRVKSTVRHCKTCKTMTLKPL